MRLRSARAARWNGLVWLAAALAAAVAVACSSSSVPPAKDAGGSGCVSSPACPEGRVPSYKTEIVPILETACIPCHSPSGTAGFDETTYSEVANQAGPILSQVAVCAMPPLNGPQLTEAQRIALTGWLECGAPNN